MNAVYLLVASIICFFASYFFLGQMTYKDNKDECDANLLKEATSYKEGGDCHVWDGSQCRKGQFKDNECISRGNKLPLFFMGLGFILFLASMVCFIWCEKSSNQSSSSKSKSSKSKSK